MDLSGVCPTEDAVQAFLDYLVDPMLPAKSSARETPSLSQQKKVAKQVHAVGLLYNYYHRKQHPELEFLDFESFCKLAAVLKPPLLTYMKLMQRSDDTELDDLEKQISITEKTIMDACDICNTLVASKDVPDLNGWPISKVAVFLLDSGEENCLLQFCSVTQGVWSVIEREIDNEHSHSSEDTVEAKNIKKKKNITKRSVNTSTARDAELLQLAFSAVKDATGINQTDLLMLERHVVYSLSKEKTAAQFFLMRCTQVINEDVAQVPIRDVIDSLHGPLVKKSSRSWTATPVVEYFHVLPYAGIISQWLSRDSTSNSLQELKVGLEIVSLNDSVMIKTPCDIEVDKIRERSNGNSYAAVEVCNRTTSTSTSPNERDNNGSCMNGLSNNLSGPHNTDIDRSSAVCPQYEEKNKNVPDTSPVDLHQKETTPSLGTNQIILTRDFKVKAKMVDSVVQCTSEHDVEKFAPANKTCNTDSSDQDGMPPQGQALITYQSDSEHLHKLHAIVSKENILSQTALRVLLRKRDNLVQQQRNIEDEIAQCDKNIQTILSGGEDDMALKIESIIEGCNDVFLRSNTNTQDRAYQPFEGQVSPRCIKRKRLSEAVLSMENPSQELDNICYKNNWVLPTYRVSPSDGGFQAGVTVKGLDFDFSCSGDPHDNPRDARESAALQMLTKLRTVVCQAH